MVGASPAATRPTPNSATDASSGRTAPWRSAQDPAATMPTTLAARVAEKATANRSRPSRSAVTVGITVATARASKAARKTSATAPTVAPR